MGTWTMASNTSAINSICEDSVSSSALHMSTSVCPVKRRGHNEVRECRRGDGYVALPEDDIENARMAGYEKQQEKLEEESEKLLMAVYDALYKVRRYHC